MFAMGLRLALLLVLGLLGAALRPHEISNRSAESPEDEDDDDEDSDPEDEGLDDLVESIMEDLEDVKFEDVFPEKKREEEMIPVGEVKFTPQEIEEMLEHMPDLDEEEEEDVITDGDTDQDQPDDACLFSAKSENLLDWLRIAKHSPNHHCEDFGRRFGRWGAAACPDLKDIIADVESGAKVASGGKSGTSPLRSSKFVVKLIDPIEHKMLHHLLHKLKGSRRDTLLAPTCRSLSFKVGNAIKYVQVSPSILLHGAKSARWRRLFDLKGNYGWKNRVAGMKEQVWKDANFRHFLPAGLKILEVAFPKSGGGHEFYEGAEGANRFARIIYHDARLLARSRLMDYSLLLHLVPVTTGGPDFKELNTDKPMATAAGTIKGRKDPEVFAISFGIIDLLMHEDENRGFWNKFASGMSFSTCSVTDLDPIPAYPYWIRFCRMLGLQLASQKDGKCESCLGQPPGIGYTYFRSDWAAAMQKQLCIPDRYRK